MAFAVAVTRVAAATAAIAVAATVAGAATCRKPLVLAHGKLSLIPTAFFSPFAPIPVRVSYLRPQ